MGTTCSTLILLPEGALIAHIGDSRVYRVRGHRIDQLSFDHSLAWELVRPEPPEPPKRPRRPSPATSSPGASAPTPISKLISKVPCLLSRATSSCSVPTASRATLRTPSLASSPPTSTRKTRLAIPGRPGQPPRRAGQHHLRDRPDRPLGRARECPGYPQARRPEGLGRSQEWRPAQGPCRPVWPQEGRGRAGRGAHLPDGRLCGLGHRDRVPFRSGPPDADPRHRAHLAGRLDPADDLPPSGRRSPRRRQAALRACVLSARPLPCLARQGGSHKKAANVS